MAVTWVFLAIYIVFFSIPSVIWFIVNRKNPLIQGRGWQWNIMSAPVELYAFIVVTILNEVGLDCRAFQWQIGVFFFPLWVGPCIIRGFKLYFDFKTAQDQASFSSSSRFLKNKWINTFPFGLLVLFLFLIFFVLLSLPVYYSWPTPNPDITSYGQCLGQLIFNVSIEGSVILAIVTILAVLLWTVQDSFGIKLEFTILTIGGTPALIVWLLLDFAFQGSWGAFHESHVPLIFFFFVRGFTWLFPAYLIYQNQKVVEVDGHQIDVDGSDIVTLFMTCIQNDGLSAAFQTFTIQSFCAENLIFYKKATQYESLPLNDLIPEAKRIRNDFLREFAPFELNIDYSIKHEVLRNIDSGNIKETTFVRMKDAVLHQLLHDSFSRWLKTESFRKAWNQHRNDSTNPSRPVSITSPDRSDDMMLQPLSI